LKDLRVGIDVGGTFTDLVAYDGSSKTLVHVKVLSTPRRPVEGILASLEALNRDIKSINTIIHATTLGTNLFLGQVGLKRPKAILITNRGFKDIIEIGRQNRPELYNLFFTKPAPLIPRYMRIEIKGRIGPYGEEIEPIDKAEVKSLAKKYSSKVNVFVICLLHSYINPAHEAEVKRIIQEVCPEAIVVTSHEVDPQPKEYERMSTTIVNALLKPVLSEYLRLLKDELHKRGFTGIILIMQSSGGVASIEVAIEKPAAFIESGPAAGAVAVAYFSRLLCINKALGFDMGGTTAKASAIVNGEPEVTMEYEVGGKVHMGRLLRGSGYPVRYPYIDLAEVSAGGGTIAWVDAGGSLRVGPLSAGADPGPACYGRGGTEPTITDANLILGRLPPILAKGRITLRRDLAEKAIKKVADKIGMNITDTAFAIVKLANTIMSRALRIVSIERGHDPRDFHLFAFGGAGPLHAVALAEDLEVKEVIIPPLPGVFSALGLLVTDYRHDLHQSIVKLASEVDEEEIENVFDSLMKKAMKILLDEGISEENVKIMRFLDMRYWGQAYELTIPYNGCLSESIKEFHRIHEERYGYSVLDEPVEIVTVRIRVIGIIEKPSLPRKPSKEHKPNPISAREVFFGSEGWVKTCIYKHELLQPGAIVEGPAVIEGDESTILVPPNYTAYTDEYYALHISKS